MTKKTEEAILSTLSRIEKTLNNNQCPRCGDSTEKGQLLCRADREAIHRGTQPPLDYQRGQGAQVSPPIRGLEPRDGD